MAQHSRRKGVNSEVKQYQLMKTEAERWQSLQAQKADAVVHHVVWRLFHVEQGIKEAESRIDERNEQLKALWEENDKFEDEVRGKKKEVNKAQKDVTKQEREVKSKEKELEDAVRTFASRRVFPLTSHALLRLQRPAIDSIQAKRQHALKRLKGAEASAATQSADLDTLQKKLDDLNKDLETTNRAAQRHRDTQDKAAREKGISLSPQDVAEYNRLCVPESYEFSVCRVDRIVRLLARARLRARPSRSAKRSPTSSTTTRRSATRLRLRRTS